MAAGFHTWQAQGLETLIAQESLDKEGARCVCAELLILLCFFFQKKTLSIFFHYDICVGLGIDFQNAWATLGVST